jgi:XTP/dITP diphosphohydrolase
VCDALPAGRPVGAGAHAPVLLSSDPRHPAVQARLAAGDRLLAVPDPPPGERLLDAVAMMDTLRIAGPWESEQTHDSLRRYLLEETYEVLDAVHRGDAAELRDELGDVLLQVLFHARIAEDASHDAFGIDDVADALICKLGNRVPAVLAGESITLQEQLAQWERSKAAERLARARVSAMDGVPTALPALALAQKVIARCTQAGLPVDLLPPGLTTVTVSADVDAESALRSAALEFMDAVRATENAIATRGVRAGITEAQWRAFWPPAGQGAPIDPARPEAKDT